MNKITLNQVKEKIKSQFKNTRFTIGDINYSFYEKYNRSQFGTIRNIVVKLSKESFLEYRIENRGVPLYKSEKKIKGASYKLK